MNPRPVHFAIFIYGLTGGGAQRRTLTLANGFAARGHRVDLVVVRHLDSAIGPPAPGVRVVPLEKGSLLPLDRSGRGLQTALSIPALADYLRRENPDLLLSAANHVHLVALLARRLSGRPIPLVLRASNNPEGNLQHYPPLQKPLRWFLRGLATRLYPQADGVIVVSRGVAERLIRLTGMPAEKIAVIYNPVVGPELLRQAAAPLTHPWLAPGQPPVILGAGKLKLQKDFPTLVRAFAKVRRQRAARLIILGEGRERQALHGLVAELGLSADVDFPGYVRNPYPWMARAAVFVLSSAWEGLPGALIEALACGCPVVSTDCPSGPAEILEDGRYGPLVPVGDDRALAGAILQVLEHPPESRRLRQRGAQFAVEPALERYLEILLPLAGAERCRNPAKTLGEFV